MPTDTALDICASELGGLSEYGKKYFFLGMVLSLSDNLGASFWSRLRYVVSVSLFLYSKCAQTSQPDLATVESELGHSPLCVSWCSLSHSRAPEGPTARNTTTNNGYGLLTQLSVPNSLARRSVALLDFLHDIEF